jgi:hypothetical protein
MNERLKEKRKRSKKKKENINILEYISKERKNCIL